MKKTILFILLVCVPLLAEHGEAPAKKEPLPEIPKNPKDSPLAYVCTPTKPNKQVKKVLVKGRYPGNSIGNEYLNWVVVEGKNALETEVSGAPGSSFQKLISKGPEKLVLEMNASTFPKISGILRFNGKTGEIDVKLQCVYKG
jgi:hypothetical protein